MKRTIQMGMTLMTVLALMGVQRTSRKRRSIPNTGRNCGKSECSNSCFGRGRALYLCAQRSGRKNKGLLSEPFWN